MSEMHRAKQVMTVAGQVSSMLADACERIEVAGSLRRGKATVKDVEIVAIPRWTPALLARLDRLVLEGTIRKAEYGVGGLHRWGEKYRGFVYKGVRFEVFLANADNWGYIFWLRTGPGDANQYVMTRMMLGSAPVRCRGADVWHEGRKLVVAEEEVFFGLLGMRWVPPSERTMAVYRRALNRPRWGRRFVYAAVEEEPPSQMSMF